MIEYFRHNMLPCPFKSLFGIECPGCGMQRALIELLDGNILLSIKYYPALIPLIVMFAFLFLHLKFSYRKGTMILKILFLGCALLITLSYTLKLLNIQIL